MKGDKYEKNNINFTLCLHGGRDYVGSVCGGFRRYAEGFGNR